MATHSSILAWKIPWTGEPGGLQSMGRTEPDMTEQLSTAHGTAIPCVFLLNFGFEYIFKSKLNAFTLLLHR